MKCGLIVMGDLPKNGKNMKCGFIVMGDLLRWKKYDEVRKIRLTWRSPEGMTEEGLENLVLPDNSRS